MRYYVGPWVWDTSFGGQWRPPEGTVGLIDARSLPGHSTAGHGFFAVADDVSLGSDYRLFGQGYITDVKPKESDRATFASMLGVPAVEGETLMDWLWTAMTIHADPTGDAALRPLMPTVQKQLDVHLGGHSLVRRKAFDLALPEAAPVIEVLRGEYAKLKKDAKAGKLKDDRHHLRCLDAMIEKYGGDEKTFGETKEKRLKHETTYTDSFTRANQELDATGAWVEVIGDWDIVSNACELKSVASNSLARYNSDLSSADHYAQFTFSSVGFVSGNYVGPAVRCASAAATAYHALCRDSDNLARIYKMVTGTITQLVAGTLSFTPPVLLKVTANGSGLELFIGGVSANTVTDTAIAGNLRGGMFGNTGDSSAGGPILDDFETADLSAGVTAKPWLYYRLMGA